jgi:hypothetical protein
VRGEVAAQQAEEMEQSNPGREAVTDIPITPTSQRRTRRPSITQRLADEADRLRFANALLLQEIKRDQPPSCCFKLCQGHQAVIASTEKIQEESAATIAEYRAGGRL